MDLERSNTALTENKTSYNSTKIILSLLALLSVLILLQSQPSTLQSSTLLNKWKGSPMNFPTDILISRLRDSVTFLPLKDLRFSKTPMDGNTWIMSSINDTRNKNEPIHLYFPSETSKGRLLCIKGNNTRDGTANSYALAWRESLPQSAKLIEGLTFISDTYYDHVNLWHGLDAVNPFVSWSINNGCTRPERWLLFHWGELRPTMGPWLQHLMESTFGEFRVEAMEQGEVPHCFERAVVMRHNAGGMGIEKKLEVCDHLRCKARRYCKIDPKGKELNENGKPIIRLTLLMRRGARSFKNATAVIDIFSRECAEVEGCILKVFHSDDLSFCDQVKVMSYTDIIASPHGAQSTNMLFMNRNGSVMEFFPKGWLELAGVGQYVYHWMAAQSGLIHQGAWWETMDKRECPSPQNNLDCFLFYKDGKVGHNQTHFAQWAKTVLSNVKAMKDAISDSKDESQPKSTACLC